MRTAMALVAAAVFGIAGCGGGESHGWKSVDNDDPRLESAKRQARDGYPDFVKALKKPKPMTLYSADVLYEEGDESEMLALDVKEATADELTGAIIGYPRKVDLHQGDLVTVPAASVIDWKIETAEGETIGGYVEAERIRLERGG